MQEIGKILFITGLVMAGIGFFIWKSGTTGVFGKLPGDIFVQKQNFTFYFPIATCILISVILTLLMWLFRR